MLAFTELAAMAVANSESREQLAASRARVVAAADESRRRIERNLHDGIQQRLISLALEMRVAASAIPPEQAEPRQQWNKTVRNLAAVTEDLREVSRGLHPAILEDGGLGPALRALARRSAVPVDLSVSVRRRLPEQTEITAYYVVSEALANVAKHARASQVRVEAQLTGNFLRLLVRDDGRGGADTARGSGLLGLSDRVGAGDRVRTDTRPQTATKKTAVIRDMFTHNATCWESWIAVDLLAGRLCSGAVSPPPFPRSWAAPPRLPRRLRPRTSWSPTLKSPP